MHTYRHPSNDDNFNDWRWDSDWWCEALFERNGYDI